MVEWSRDYYIDPATTGLNAVYHSSATSDDADFAAQAASRQSRAASINLKLPLSESSECVYVTLVECVWQMAVQVMGMGSVCLLWTTLSSSRHRSNSRRPWRVEYSCKEGLNIS